MANFKALRNIDIMTVCQWLGIKLKAKGSHYRAQCPICKHASQRAFVVTPSMNRWWCHAICKSGGDALELVVRLKKLDHKAAAALLINTFKLPP